MRAAVRGVFRCPIRTRVTGTNFALQIKRVAAVIQDEANKDIHVLSQQAGPPCIMDSCHSVDASQNLAWS